MGGEDSEGIAAIEYGISFFVEAMTGQKLAEAISCTMVIFRTQIHRPVFRQEILEYFAPELRRKVEEAEWLLRAWRGDWNIRHHFFKFE